MFGRGGGGGGGGLQKNVSQILATIDFSSEEMSGKNSSVRKNCVRHTHKFDQTSRLNLERFDMGHNVPDC